MSVPSNDLPQGYRFFNPSLDDVPRATEFFNLVEISEWGVPDFDEGEVREEWEELDLERSVVLVENMAGELVASMTLVNHNGVTWEAFGYVHPDHQKHGLGAWVIRWSEAVAQSREAEMKPSYQISIMNYISTVNAAAQRLLGSLGYDLDKVFRRMRIELYARPDDVAWPAPIALRPFVEGRDERAFFAALETSFAEHWSAAPRTFESWSKWSLSGDYDTNLWLQIVDGDRVVGICSGKQVGDGGWIGYVGVIPDYRRRGLAKLMLQECFGRFWDKGIWRVDLGVDSENRQSAVELYLGAGMRETHSYEANRKVLRDGLDWRDEE